MRLPISLKDPTVQRHLPKLDSKQSITRNNNNNHNLTRNNNKSPRLMRQSWYIQPKKSRDWTRFGSLKGYILASHSGQKEPRDKEGRDREGLGNSSCNSHPFQSWVANFFENTLERGKIIRDSTCNKEWQNMLATFARSLYRAFGPGQTHCPLPPIFVSDRSKTVYLKRLFTIADYTIKFSRTLKLQPKLSSWRSKT